MKWFAYYGCFIINTECIFNNTYLTLSGCGSYTVDHRVRKGDMLRYPAMRFLTVALGKAEYSLPGYMAVYVYSVESLHQ